MVLEYSGAKAKLEMDVPIDCGRICEYGSVAG